MVSIKELAQRCGVSVATVSKALNDKSDIGEETKKRIREIADEMGYFPNASARTLRSKRSYRKGVLFVGGQSGTAAEGKGSNATASASGAFLYVPFFMTYEDYETWAVQQSMQQYFKKKNADEAANAGKEKFDFTDMHFGLGPADKIFGPGGVRIKTTGSAELKIGGNLKFTDNPTLSERNRKVFGFDRRGKGGFDRKNKRQNNDFDSYDD